MDNNSFGDIAVTDLVFPREVRVGENFDLSITIANVGTETVEGRAIFAGPFFSNLGINGELFLSEDDRFDGFGGDSLLFIDGSSQIEFSNFEVSRDPSLESELPLAPGESVTVTTNTVVNRTSGTAGFTVTGDRFLIFSTEDGEFANVEGVNSDNNILAKPITILPFQATPIIRGTRNADELTGTARSEEIRSFAGNDTIRSGAGLDTVRGGDGSDRIFGQNGDDDLFGGNGNDKLVGGAGNDNLQGNSGNDQLFGNAGSDNLKGGNGNDTLFGNANSDRLDGGNGNDKLVGGDNNDILIGGSGSDTLNGGNGNDILAGDAGFNVLTGGQGADDFFVERGRGVDVITDFQLGIDTISLSGLAIEDVTFEGINIKVGNQAIATLIGVDTAELVENDSIRDF